MAVGFEHEYPPSEWTVDQVQRALADADETYQIPTSENRAVWNRLRSSDLTGRHVDAILADARDQRGEAVPPLPASDFLEFERTGGRYSYQDPEGLRTSRLNSFTIAECFDREGAYLDDILDYAWAICEQSSWVLPAHLRNDHDGLPGAVDDEQRIIDLHSAWIAGLLGEVDHLLGDRLHPALRDRIRTEVDERVLTPYLARDDHFWLAPPASNWNAVCNSGVMIAALHLTEDPERRARIVTKGCHALGQYLAAFDEDGCTAEGIEYWNYGFGHYVAVGAALAARTDGALSLLSPPIVADIAEYPLGVELSPGRYVQFSDAEEHSRVSPGTASLLGTALDKEGLGALGRDVLEEDGPTSGTPMSMGVLRDLLWASEVPAEWRRSAPPRAQFFGGLEWWFARDDPSDPDGLVAAAKGGHNDEHHNHNDCGTFMIHYRGESLLTDIGRPEYDRDYFIDDERYDYLTARSLGHSVPYVNGFEQAHGAEHAAAVVDRGGGDAAERFGLELAACYPDAAALDSLRRTVTLARGSPGSVTVSNEATFTTDGPRTYESVLISHFPMDVTEDGLVVTGERGRATVTPSNAAASITTDRLAAAVKGRDVWRARIDPGTTEDAGSGTVELTVTVDLEQL